MTYIIKLGFITYSIKRFFKSEISIQLYPQNHQQKVFFHFNFYKYIKIHFVIFNL